MKQKKTIAQLIEERTVAIPEAGCWIWMHAMSHGYGNLRTKERLLLAHRASYEAFVGPIPDGLWVLHRCDVRACVNPHHLFLGTRQDNIDDANKKGRLKHKPGRVRPSGLRYKRQHADKDARILELLSLGLSQREVGRRFGISHHTVAKTIRDSIVCEV